LPTQTELQTWFANPDNGIGTLGGWHNIVWIDVDVKLFESAMACEQRMAAWLNQHPLLQQTFTERTHSGGWRLAVRVQDKTFTNFSLDWVAIMWGKRWGRGALRYWLPRLALAGTPTSISSGYRRFGWSGWRRLDSIRSVVAEISTPQASLGP
jgi:hypothetical protein